MRHGRLAYAAAAFLWLAGRVTFAQNLVVNPDFDTDVASWTIPVPGATIAWSPLDWQADPGSGSALVTNELAFAGGLIGAVSTCMVTPTAGVYEYGARILIPSGQASTGNVFVARVFYGFPGCAGIGSVLIDELVPTTTTDVWVPVLIRGLPHAAGTEVQIMIGSIKDQATGTLAAHFDFVRFGLEGTTPVDLLGFRVE